MIVCADADLDRAVAGAVANRYYNCGQVCTAVKRLFVHEAIAPAFMAPSHGVRSDAPRRHRRRARGAHGPPEQRRRARPDRRARRRGGRAGRRDGPRPGATYPEGEAFAAGLLRADRRHRCRARLGLLREEVFGPVLPVVTFATSRRGDRPRERHTLRPRGIDLDADPVDCPRGDRAARGRDRLGEPPPEGTSRSAVRRRQASGLGRENGVQALDAWSETKTVLVRFLSCIESTAYRGPSDHFNRAGGQ